LEHVGVLRESQKPWESYKEDEEGIHWRRERMERRMYLGFINLI